MATFTYTTLHLAVDVSFHRNTHVQFSEHTINDYWNVDSEIALSPLISGEAELDLKSYELDYMLATGGSVVQTVQEADTAA